MRSVAAAVEGVVSIALLVSQLPPPSHAAEPAPAFDLAAASASLESIEYLDCGPGAVAEVAVTFAPTGRVHLVTITNASLRSDVATCVAERFARAEAPPFSGEPRTLHCRIRLAQ